MNKEILKAVQEHCDNIELELKKLKGIIRKHTTKEIGMDINNVELSLHQFERDLVKPESKQMTINELTSVIDYFKYVYNLTPDSYKILDKEVLIFTENNLYSFDRIEKNFKLKEKLDI